MYVYIYVYVYVYVCMQHPEILFKIERSGRYVCVVM